MFLHAGKSAERPILSEANIEHNVQSIQALLQRLLSQGGGQGTAEPVLLNNLDWFGTMPLLTFLRQVQAVPSWFGLLLHLIKSQHQMHFLLLLS